MKLASIFLLNFLSNEKYKNYKNTEHKVSKTADSFLIQFIFQFSFQTVMENVEYFCQAEVVN